MHNLVAEMFVVCAKRKVCDADDPTGKKCEYYYLCNPQDASPETLRLIRGQRRRFNRDMKKLDKIVKFLDGVLTEVL